MGISTTAIGLGVCNVQLDRQVSNFANCTANESFGCVSAQEMWASKGCRGLFRCGSLQVMCEGPYQGRLGCSCVPCSEKPRNFLDGALLGLHCCAENGAALSHGSWDPIIAGSRSADHAACRDECARTPGCTHASYTEAPPSCADDLRKASGGFGRCSLCGACQRRLGGRQPSWQGSFASYEVTSPSRSQPPDSSSQHEQQQVQRRLPALIISGCDTRYERAAAVARAASLDPTWLLGVFPENVHPSGPRCSWPTVGERNLLVAHRNAWSVIASSGVGMVVLEDDIELATSPASLRRDVRRCETLGGHGGCALMLLGYVDAYWATHAMYVAPEGARKLLKESAGQCAEPTDYHTHRLCVGDLNQGKPHVRDAETATPSTWHRQHRLSGHCLAANASVSGAEMTQLLLRHGRGARASAVRLRAPELYGVGHFVQNRTRGYIHAARGFAKIAEDAKGQGSHC